MIVHALQNVKVVDLSMYIAGSLCPSLLADLGAEVVKVETHQGDPFRLTAGGFQTWNRAKRSICINLKTDEGKEILYSLVKACDVVVENYRPGVAQKLGADYETLRSINPALIYCSISGYGQSGPYREKPAFDPLLQAMSGAMTHQGGPGNPPVFPRVAISDYGAAVLGAYGIAMALYARARTGVGQKVETSLLNSTMCGQAGRFILCRGRADGEDDSMSTDRRGPTPTYRLYPTADGWIFLGAANDDGWVRMARAVDREELARDPRFDSQAKRLQSADELVGILEGIFATQVSARWLERLEAEGVPCSRVNYFDDLFHHPQMLRNGLVAEHDSLDVGLVKQLGVPVMFSRTPGIARGPAPALGQHTDEVLSELGYSLSQVKTLRDKKVVK